MAEDPDGKFNQPIARQISMQQQTKNERRKKWLYKEKVIVRGIVGGKGSKEEGQKSTKTEMKRSRERKKTLIVRTICQHVFGAQRAQMAVW